MYNASSNGLGQAPATSSPSIWDSFSNLVSTGVSAGFNIYNKVQTLTQQKKQATEAQAQANLMRQVYGQPAYGQPGYGQLQPAYGQRYAGQSDFFGGWTMPLLIGGAAIVGIVLFTRK